MLKVFLLVWQLVTVATSQIEIKILIFSLILIIIEPIIGPGSELDMGQFFFDDFIEPLTKIMTTRVDH